MYMTNITNVCGHEIKIAVINSGKTREKVVVLVQDIVRKDGLSFSLAGLDKLFKGELPKKDPQKILDALSLVLGVSTSTFAEEEAKTA